MASLTYVDPASSIGASRQADSSRCEVGVVEHDIPRVRHGMSW